MDDVGIGSAIRAVRRRRRLRQADVAARVGVARLTVSRIERGMLGRYPIDVVRRVATVLEMRLDVGIRWHGGDLDHVRNADHAALHESIGWFLATLVGWTWSPEVTYSVYGERGVIDILAWHAETRTLLIIELKTTIVDPHDLVAAMDRRRRLAHRIAADRGWRPLTVASWVVVSDTRTNRRRVAEHANLLRAAFPFDGRAMRSWLRRPSSPVAALSFWTDDPPRITRPVRARAPRSEGRSKTARSASEGSSCADPHGPVPASPVP